MSTRGKRPENPFAMDNSIFEDYVNDTGEEGLRQNPTKMNKTENHNKNQFLVNGIDNTSNNSQSSQINDIMNTTVEDILHNKLGLNIGNMNPTSVRKHAREKEQEEIVNPNPNRSNQNPNSPYIMEHKEEKGKGLSKFEKIAGVATLLVAGKYVVDAFSKKGDKEETQGEGSGETPKQQSSFIAKIIGLAGLSIIGVICVIFGWIILGNTLYQFEGTKFEEGYYDITKKIISPYQNEDGTTPTPSLTLDVLEDFKERSLELKIAPYKKLDDKTILVKIGENQFIKSKRESIKNVGYVRVVIARVKDSSIESIIVGNKLAGKCTDLELLPGEGGSTGEAFVCGNPTIVKNVELFNKEAYLSLINKTSEEVKGFWDSFLGKSSKKGDNKEVELSKEQGSITEEPTENTIPEESKESGEISDEERLQLELELQERVAKEKYENSFDKYAPNTEIVGETADAIVEKAREVKEKIGQTIGDK